MDLAGTAYAGEGVAVHPVEVFHIHRVEAAVVADGFDIDVGPKQLGALGLDIDGAFQDGLGGCGEIDAQVLQALFVPAGIIDLSGMDANGLPGRRIAAERAGGNSFRHKRNLLIRFEEYLRYQSIPRRTERCRKSAGVTGLFHYGCRLKGRIGPTAFLPRKP